MNYSEKISKKNYVLKICFTLIKYTQPYAILVIGNYLLKEGIFKLIRHLIRHLNNIINKEVIKRSRLKQGPEEKIKC